MYVAHESVMMVASFEEASVIQTVGRSAVATVSCKEVGTRHCIEEVTKFADREIRQEPELSHGQWSPCELSDDFSPHA